MSGVCTRLFKQFPARGIVSSAARACLLVRHSTAAATSSNDTNPAHVNTEGAVVEESVDEEQQDVISASPHIFHTRTLTVHEAFRRFRPPRETWLYSFSDLSKRGLVELHPVVFAANPRVDLIHDVVKWQDACVREDEIVYMRSELPGSNRKLRPQKGTGQPRMKDKRAPHFKFGGRPLGRRPRDHGYDIDINVLTAAFSAICTAKHAQGDLYLVDSLQDFTIASLVKFKEMVNSESVLFVSGWDGLSSAQNTEICFQPGIDLLTTETVHPKAILQHRKLVLDYTALTQLETWVLEIGREHKLEDELEYFDTS